ncbi:MAG: TRAP transporter small permease [Rubrivivax sp.]|nr:TRAP transporter small permease [Rubrivivax sp.]
MKGGWLQRRIPNALRDAAAFGFLPGIVLVVAVDVVARYFFNRPYQWSQEVASLLLLLVFVAAIPYTNADDGHIRTESLYERYGVRTRAVVDLLSALCGGAFMLVVSGWQLRELPGMIDRGEGAEFVALPYWPISLFVALCMLFGVVQVVVQALGHVRTIATGVRDGA